VNPDAKVVMYCVTVLILIAPFAFWGALSLVVSIRPSAAGRAALLIELLLPSGWVAALVLAVLYVAGTLRLDAWPLAAALAVSSAVLLLPRAWLRAKMSASPQSTPELRAASAAGENAGPQLGDKTPGAIIRTPRGALVVLIVAAYYAAWQLWHFTLAPQPRAHWIFPLHSLGSNWPAVAMNVFIYGLFLVMLVGFLRDLRGAERILFAIGAGEVLIVPVQRYASAPIATAIVWAQAFGALVMFLAAVQLFQRLRQVARETRESATGE
jgi:hypothetical protein